MAYWTISNTSTNRTEGNDLNNLDIEQVFNQSNQLTGYQLVDPDATDPQEAVVASTNQTSPPLEFNNVEWDGQTWNIHVPNGLTPDEDGSGTWHLHGHKRTGGQDGDFTAQAGSGAGEEPDEAADSAKA